MAVGLVRATVGATARRSPVRVVATAALLVAAACLAAVYQVTLLWPLA